MKNEIRFTLESKQRSKLAREIGNILGIAPHYERGTKLCMFSNYKSRFSYLSKFSVAKAAAFYD